MKEETKAKLRSYGICVGVELVIAVLVIWSKGFFKESLSSNMIILSDAFSVPGILMTLFAGLMYVSSEGALIGIGYVMRNVVLFFIPMGRNRHERYADYRERKLSKAKNRNNRPILFTGLAFLFIGIVLNLIWSSVFYNV